MMLLSSISGNGILAQSAQAAPTNSAEVSAIASAYQVVSATATQLYAGTAYVTSINEAPVSAARAGNSVNATLATSAYYDGTGRLISALPDNAAVSAIASSYAESAALGKLDSSASSSFYPANNPSGFISSVDLSNYATTAYVDSSISGFAYNSAVSGWTAKQDALTFGYNAEDKISGINGSALAGEGGGLVTAIGTSTSGITSINNSGLVDTAALRSADYSSLYVQEPLYISASGDSSYIGISGNVGGIDSATCSAIASAYAESAVSSVSGNYYTTANESGYALSSDVSATVDLVGTQSANWGGSALALSAGHGVKLTKSGDTLVVSTDLSGYVWKSASLYASANPTMSTAYTLTNYCSAYDTLEIDFYDANTWRTQMECPIPPNLAASGTRGGYFNAVASDGTTAASVWFKCFRWSAIGTNWYCQVDEIAGAGGSTNQTVNANQSVNPPKVLQIVGWKREELNV